MISMLICSKRANCKMAKRNENGEYECDGCEDRKIPKLPLKEKLCEKCGAAFQTRSMRKELCPKCQKALEDSRRKFYGEARKQSQKVNERRKRLKIKELDQKTVCNLKHKCKYGGKAGDVSICNYMEIEGHARRCGVGEECTKFARKKRGRNE